MVVAEPKAIVDSFERAPLLPAGEGERFAGYGVMAAPFRSGHLLAMRRFPASSVGRGYTSVWHRAPDGTWTFYADEPPLRSCARYFGSALARAVQVPIEVEWTGPSRFEVRIPSESFWWEMRLGETTATRALNAMARAMPEALWHSEGVLGAMAFVAGKLLDAGRMKLSGQAPNGQHFVANPMQMWTLESYSARLGDEDFGPPGPLPRQARLGDFWIPQRALFAVARAFLETTDPSRHHVIDHAGAEPLPV
jgi:hypothetical protein